MTAILLGLLAIAFAEPHNEQDVGLELHSLTAAIGGQVLVAGVGADAAKMLQRLMRRDGTLNIMVTQIPSAGNRQREIQHVLNASGLHCMILVSPDVENTWNLEVQEGCSNDPVMAVSPSPAPDAAPSIHSNDPQRTFKERSLSLVETESNWAIEDGQQRRITAAAFAGLLADQELMTQLKQEQQRASREANWLKITGGILGIGAIIPFVGINEAGPTHRADRAWTSVFLGATGTALIVTATIPSRAVNDRQRAPHRYYTETEAMRRVDSFNQELRTGLGTAEDPAIEGDPEVESEMDQVEMLPEDPEADQ